MTRWVEDPVGGRDRGPIALARAWVEVLVRPRRFFQTGIAAGNQAPALTFLLAIVTIEEASRYVFVSGAVPAVAGNEYSSAVVALAVTVLIIAPLSLHLIAALQTVILRLFLPDRGGVSETVQVLAYATAPCVFAGIPVPEIRLLCAGYGGILYVIGLHTIHDMSLWKGVTIGAIPGAIAFGYGFRGFQAALTLLGG